MTQDLITQPGKKANIVSLMASRYNLSEDNFLSTLKGTIMKPDKNGNHASNEELTAFLMVANQYDLNPFMKEIYAFPDKRAGIIPIVGVDGFIRIANRDANYDGYDLIWADEAITMDSAKPCPEWCEIKVYRKDREHPMVAREYLDEVYQAPRNGFSGPWQTHTKRMLRHKTIIQGFRVAFGLSGIYDEDEAERIVEAQAIDIEHSVQSTKPETERPQRASENKPPASNGNGNYISEPQRKRLLAIAKGSGYEFDEVEQHVLYNYEIDSTKSIPRDKYEEIVEHFQVQKGV